MINIRNFAILAHIDHGKSTLADRFLEITGTVEKRHMRAQYLDQLELERERGITIKMAPVRMVYHPDRGMTQTDTQNNAEEFLYEDLTFKIRGLLFQVRKKLGLGHKEQVYHNAIELELRNAGLSFVSKKNIPISYDGKHIGTYQPDFVIDDKVILELKALPEIGRPQIEQIWSYLRGCNYKLALLVNFGSQDLEIKRIVFDKARGGSFLRPSALSRRNSAEVKEYILNLIDTPGHTDFSYEVSRALAAVDGAILLVDATQGIQAQTLANFNSAKKAGLTIIGAVNKIDLNPILLPEVVKSTAELLGVPESEIFKVSGKTGQGVRELLDGVVEQVPAPQTHAESTQINARALIFDSFYHEHKGIVAAVRIFNGVFNDKENAHLIATNTDFKIKELGYFAPELKTDKNLENGQIGYIATGLKDPELLRIGDTVIAQNSAERTQNHAEKFLRKSASSPRESASLALPGYKEPQPVVFVSFYPEESDDYEDLKSAFGKLKLNDSALKFEPDFNEFLGRGFKTGFLGKLHFEITAERLEKEFGLRTVHSFPSVAYKVRLRGKTQIDTQKDAEIQHESAWITVSNPKDFPDDYLEVMEPIAKVEILTPAEYLGSVLRLQEVFRLKDLSTQNFGGSAVLVTAMLPLSELIRNFDDQLKSISAGYASLSYEVSDYEKTGVSKLSILIAGQEVGGLTRIIYKEDAEREARKTVERLKDLLPKQQFSQALQAVAGGRILARENIPALKKLLGNFGKTGGDRTRKMKLWKKQQRGKTKLKEIAAKTKIDIPASIFKELLKK